MNEADNDESRASRASRLSNSGYKTLQAPIMNTNVINQQKNEECDSNFNQAENPENLNDSMEEYNDDDTNAPYKDRFSP